MTEQGAVLVGGLQARAQRLDLGVQIVDAHQHGVGIVVARHLFAVRPFVLETAFDQAMRVPASRALHLLEQHPPAKECAGEPRGITEQHPARGLALRPPFALVGLGFPTVVPAHLAAHAAGLLVHIEHLRRGAHRAFQAMQLRADGEHVEEAARGPNLARQQRVALAGGVATAHQQAPRMRGADGVHHLAPQRNQRRRMQKQHALAGQPDAPVLRGETHEVAQVGIGRHVWNGVWHFITIDKNQSQGNQDSPAGERCPASKVSN